MICRVILHTQTEERKGDGSSQVLTEPLTNVRFLVSSIFTGYFCCLSLPHQLPPLHMCDGNAVRNCPNMLPETFRVSLHCRWVNCVKIFNPINHDDGLIRINVLILTALI